MKEGRSRFSAKGAVKRVRLKNFMTYVDETFWPGPNFNVVVGANGSGKSSIVTALCIALGGDLGNLNRQTEISSLINNNTDASEALIEVELYIREGENKTVQCTVSNSRGLSFKVDDKKVGKTELKELMEELQIQPGNMCQFLPQDVVRDFPTMDNQQIFSNTVKAVGDLSLIDTYEKLKKIQGKAKDLEEKLETKLSTFESLERKEKKLENDKKAYEERKAVIERKEVVDNALKWERFKNLRKKVKETRDNERREKAEIDRLVAEKKPLEEYLSTYDAQVASKRKEINEADKEFSAQCSKVEEFDFSVQEEKLDNIIEQERNFTEQESDRINQKKNLAEAIKTLEIYLRTNPLDPTIDEELSKLTAKKTQFENSHQRTTQALSDLQFQQANLERERDKLLRDKEKIQNNKNMKLTTLQRENNDAYQGTLWLANNRHLFKAPVHDPIMLALDVKDKSLARYVETQIGRADLEGFVCENPDDVNLLTKQLRETLRLRKINAFHSNPDPPSKFPPPTPGDQLEKFTFIDYISDMYSAPDAVHAYLCRQKGLHQVPVFREENNLSSQLKFKFHNYYIGTHKFNTRKSKYSGELSTGMEDIAGREVRRLAAVVDTQELSRINEELGAKNRVIGQNATRIATQSKTADNIKVEVDKVVDQINELRAVKKEFISKQSELDMKRKTLQEFQEPKFDLAKKKAELRLEKAKIVKQLSRLTLEHSRLTKLSIEADSKRRLLHIALQRIESDNSDHTEKLAEKNRELAVKNEQYENTTKTWEKDKKALQERHSEARKATGVLSDEVKYKPPEVWQRKFDALDTTEENVLLALLDECDTDLKHMKTISDQTIADIEALKEKIKVAREEKENLEAEFKNLKHEAKKLKNKWINGVQHLVDNVNDKFGAMMAELGYNGEIKLSQGTEEIDFSSYGIKILVR